MVRVAPTSQLNPRQLSIAVCVLDKENSMYSWYMRNNAFESRLHVTEYHAKTNAQYPINKLRNLAIESVQTTHLWLTDMDMWPSRIAIASSSA